MFKSKIPEQVELHRKEKAQLRDTITSLENRLAIALQNESTYKDQLRIDGEKHTEEIKRLTTSLKQHAEREDKLKDQVKLLAKKTKSQVRPDVRAIIDAYCCNYDLGLAKLEADCEEMIIGIAGRDEDQHRALTLANCLHTLLGAPVIVEFYTRKRSHAVGVDYEGGDDPAAG